MEQEYPNTVLRLADAAPIDLREPLGADARAAFASHGFSGAFAILSAYPAPAQQRSNVENERLTERLRSVIATYGARAIDVLAESPDGAHTEPSLAASLSRHDALAIALEFEQAALFWFDGERMWIDWTDGRPSTALPTTTPSLRFRAGPARLELDESGGH